MSRPSRKSLPRSLGEFVGHIMRGVTANPSITPVRREVTETTQDTPQGKLTLRRTVVDEVIVDRAESGPGT